MMCLSQVYAKFLCRRGCTNKDLNRSGRSGESPKASLGEGLPASLGEGLPASLGEGLPASVGEGLPASLGEACQRPLVRPASVPW